MISWAPSTSFGSYFDPHTHTYTQPPHAHTHTHAHTYTYTDGITRAHACLCEMSYVNESMHIHETSMKSRTMGELTESDWGLSGRNSARLRRLPRARGHTKSSGDFRFAVAIGVQLSWRSSNGFMLDEPINSCTTVDCICFSLKQLLSKTRWKLLTDEHWSDLSHLA